MDNIEKFEKLKKISALKAELHKEEMKTFFTLEKYANFKDVSIEKYLNAAKFAYSVYSEIKPFFNKNEK